MNFKIAGTVILYNPTPDFIINVHSYINQVERLYLINNSESSLPAAFDHLKNKDVVIIENKENRGVAGALNQAVRLALSDGFDLLLTMDQDSLAEQELIKHLLKPFSEDNKVAIVSPQHKRKNQKAAAENLTVMTSGNLVNLQIVNSTGGFDEGLFIDYVDHDICLRLISKGFKVVQLKDLILEHHLGNATEVNLMFKTVIPLNYSPERYYYQTRNRFYIYKRYKKLFPDFVKNDKINFIRDLVKMVLFEKSRLLKLKYMIRGFLDFKKTRIGKINSEKQ